MVGAGHELDQQERDVAHDVQTVHEHQPPGLQEGLVLVEQESDNGV